MQHRTEKEILLQMVQNAQDTGLLQSDEELLQKLQDGNRTENQYVLDLSTHAHVLEQLEDEANTIYLNIDLNTATGEALDCLGRLVNVTRSPAQQPKVSLTVSSPTPLEEQVTIPAGTLVIMSEESAEEGNYFTSAEVSFDANATSATVLAEHRDFGFHNPLGAGMAVGLEGFPYLSVTNAEDGTTGRNIEEDSVYRERVRAWAVKNTRGTRACLEDYLNNYDGLTSYRLIPLYDGVGTLKVVCDCLSTLLPTLEDDIDENCMLLTDEPVLCVNPSTTTLSTLELDCHLNPDVSLTVTQDELKAIISTQVDVFVNGGQNRLGASVHGLGIGSDLYPSQLVSYLLENVPEVDNIVSDPDEIVDVPDTNRLVISETEVTLS